MKLRILVVRLLDSHIGRDDRNNYGRERSDSQPLIQPRAHAPLGIAGKPFIARFRSTSSRGADAPQFELHGSVYRDAAGRMRMEHRTFTGEQVAVIADPISKDLIILNDVERAALLIRGGTGDSGNTWSFANSIPEEMQDHQTIFGTRCRRVLLKDPISRMHIGETWLADELFLVISDKAVSRDIVRESQITDLALTAPPKDLFDIPKLYPITVDE